MVFSTEVSSAREECFRTVSRASHLVVSFFAIPGQAKIHPALHTNRTRSKDHFRPVCAGEMSVCVRSVLLFLLFFNATRKHGCTW